MFLPLFTNEFQVKWLHFILKLYLKLHYAHASKTKMIVYHYFGTKSITTTDKFIMLEK